MLSKELEMTEKRNFKRQSTPGYISKQKLASKARDYDFITFQQSANELRVRCPYNAEMIEHFKEMRAYYNKKRDWWVVPVYAHAKLFGLAPQIARLHESAWENQFFSSFHSDQKDAEKDLPEDQANSINIGDKQRFDDRTWEVVFKGAPYQVGDQVKVKIFFQEVL